MKNKIVSTAEAVAIIRDGDTVAFSGFVGSGTPEELIAHYSAHPPRGEIVLLAGPPPEPAAPEAEDVDALLLAALAQASPSQAAGQVAKAHGLDRKALYARAMVLKSEA